VRVVVLTGAGVSAESGVPTFRDADGLWEGHRPEEVATPEAFAADPALVHRFYDARRAGLLSVEPNAAHKALARLEAALGEDLLVITQNVDDLHERAGSTRVLHLHGEIASALCTGCEGRVRWSAPLGDGPACPACGEPGLRPDVVWFGEMPYRLEEALAAVTEAEVFAAIGTSGVVYPAAGFVRMAYAARTVEINLERTESSEFFDEVRLGPASVVVPEWVDSLLG
jgi:NAD-dependent deacetylase